MLRLLTIVLLLGIVFVSCRPETYIPKPRGYYLIHFPKHAYQQFANAGYPYSFEYPVYANIVKDTVFFGEKPENPYWVNMNFKSLGGQLYLTYKEITPAQPLAKLMEDAYKMSNYHNMRADYIVDHRFATPNHVSGLFYNVGGNAATNYLFYATDSVKNFIWGSLYFDVTPNADSLKPVNEFIKKDMDHLLETLKWK